MIVLDASAAIEALLGTAVGRRVDDIVWGSGALVNAPHLLDVEVLQVVARLLRTRALDRADAEPAVRDLAQLDLVRHDHVDLLERARELRENATAYDGM